MKKIFYVIVAMIVIGCSQGKVQPKVYNRGINIIPAPQQIIKEKGFFHLKRNTVVGFSNKDVKNVADFFVSKLNNSTGFNIRSSMKGGDISLNLNPEMEINSEGYKLKVMPRSVLIEAKTTTGLFYGMQSFMQLLPAEIESSSVEEGMKWNAPCMEIIDAPRFLYRGVMIDVCRNFFTIKELKKQIDALSLFKINYLHLHLTDDQGWRVEIKNYPKLTQIGSIRTLGNGKKYGGYYTQEELKDLVKYASQRHITIVPEFDLPGHELAAISSYPNLACDHMLAELNKKNIKIQPRNIWGVEDIVMCPGKEDMFVFIDDVIKEMTQIFPGKYFHVGGDECPTNSWEKCPECQKRIKEEGIKGDEKHIAEKKLQGYILKRVETIVEKYGKKLIGWDEIVEGGLSPAATVMSWRGENGGISAALQNHDVIMTPCQRMYFPWRQGDIRVEPEGGGFITTLEKSYSYDPVPDTLKVMHKDNYIKGVQGSLWSEYLYTDSLLEYKLYPRAMALAEVGWTNPDKKDFKDFSRRIENAYVRLDGHNIYYHIPQPEQPDGSCNFVAFTDSVKVSFKTTRPVKMVYTLDGTEPSAESSEYKEPLKFSEDATIKIRSVILSGKMSPVRTITVKKEEFSPSVSIANKHKGLKMKIYSGHFNNASELEGKKVSNVKIIKNLNELSSQVKIKRSLRDIKYYGAVAEGYVNIPESGVYYFSSNNEEVWLDGKLLISNRGQIKRSSHNDKSAALLKGLHSLKVVFLTNVFGGELSLWDNAKIKIRKEDEKQFRYISDDELFY